MSECDLGFKACAEFGDVACMCYRRRGVFMFAVAHVEEPEAGGSVTISCENDFGVVKDFDRILGENCCASSVA